MQEWMRMDSKINPDWIMAENCLLQVMKHKRTEDLCRRMWNILNQINRQELSDNFLLGNCGRMECDIHKVEMDWAKAERETQEAQKEARRRNNEDRKELDKGNANHQRSKLMELHAISKDAYMSTPREIKRRHLP